MSHGIDNTLLSDKSKMSTGALVQRAHTIWTDRRGEFEKAEFTEILNQLYDRYVIAPQMKGLSDVSNDKN